jgi:inner membrane protein
MHKKGHIGAGLLATAPVVFGVTAAGFSTLALAGAGVVVAGSMLPDLDMRLPFVTHRGPTHTVWFAGGVGVVYGVVGAVLGSGGGLLATVALGGYGALLGALTVGAHLLADALTPMGVRPFEPVDGRGYSLSVTRAANPIANYALLALGSVAVVGAFLAGGMVA